jgi:hypothetical protein
MRERHFLRDFAQFTLADGGYRTGVELENKSAGPKVHERFGQMPDCTVAANAVATTAALAQSLSLQIKHTGTSICR